MMERIIAENVSKKFWIKKGSKTALGKLSSFFSKDIENKELSVLENVSLNVGSGEIVGLTGPNGCGKSTLLRILAGIYPHYEGSVFKKGKIVSLISLNVGLKEILSMRDNLYLICSLFGMSIKEIKNNFDSIVSFAELENFVDTRIYKFSSGMKQRLVFSIAIHANPDILLLDEVFEVGDESFKKKSANKIKEFARNGASVLLVSHDRDLIKRNCDRIMEWI